MKEKRLEKAVRREFSPDSSKLPCSADSGRICPKEDKCCAQKKEKPPRLRSGLIKNMYCSGLFFQ